MLRFGLLKYRKLNNSAVSGAESENESTAGANGNPQQHRMIVTSTPVRQQHPDQIHNQLNSGGVMKNTNSSQAATDSPTKNDDSVSKTAKSLSDENTPALSTDASEESKKSSTRLCQPSTTTILMMTHLTSSANNYKALGSDQPQPTPKKRTTPTSAAHNCKTRIYKCIKRILKRNNFAKDQHKVYPQQQEPHQHQQVQDKSKVDYREIKSLLEKEKCSLDYDVNLAKCVDKPALIKKIALNLLKSAEDEGRSLVVASAAPEHLSETTSVLSDLEQEREYQRLCCEPWYHEYLPHDFSLDTILCRTPGNFLVRKSNTHPDCYALSLQTPNPNSKIQHYRIIRTATQGFQIKGFHKEFSTLRALVVHHSVMPEALPIALAVPRPTNIAVKTKCEDDYDTVFGLSESALA
ncbi:uncharacterized protein LOC129756302 [Uranotaenia lowii]|uniref:uncharacterized protein LOC129756302 n=1 Tax=Uranotaenia lowii TaxID=190385 RepID=UPI002478E465|nr:uncharacterized protein LOC129756302 [Uranotaenia lowii]